MWATYPDSSLGGGRLQLRGSILIFSQKCDKGYAASGFGILRGNPDLPRNFRAKTGAASFRNEPVSELPLVYRHFYQTHLAGFLLYPRDREHNRHSRG